MSAGTTALRPTHVPRQHEVMTPEGVSLAFDVARAGDRLGAFLIDVVVILVGSILIVVAAYTATGFGGTDGWLWAVVYLAIFLLQTFYFIWFESRGLGTTPGKRRMGIRIMEAEGGALTTQAVTVRNMMRILEVQLPLVALLAPDSFWSGAPGWTQAIASVWLLVIAGMPLFNCKRLRVGDLVAGTVVVSAPHARLEQDVGVHAPVHRQREAAERYAFTTAQLDVYGAYELQVLEDVLRHRSGHAQGPEVLQAVAERIARKIDWKSRIRRKDAGGFLAAFYAALRARLEQRMLFGKHKKDKFSDEA